MTPPSSNSSEYSAADELMVMIARELDRASTLYAVIGGQAVVQHGYSRATLDVDFTVAAEIGKYQPVVDMAHRLGLVPNFPQDEPTIHLQQLYVTHHPELEVGADFSLVNTPYLDLAIQRGVVLPIRGYPVRFLCLEDLLIHKVIADRVQDQADVHELLGLHTQTDHAEVEHWLAEFEQLYEKPLIDRYRAMRRDAGR